MSQSGKSPPFSYVCVRFDYSLSGNSHNVLFLLALLGAVDLGIIDPVQVQSADDLSNVLEPLYDRSFALRTSGLNVDYMSYSMLRMVDDDRAALLDPATLFRTANTTFATFF